MSSMEPDDVARFAPDPDNAKVEPGVFAPLPDAEVRITDPNSQTLETTPEPGSWEDFHNQARDARERAQTRMRAMATNAALGLEYERRLARYSAIRSALIWFWSIAIVAYLIGVLFWSFGADPPPSLGAGLWLATMPAAIGLYLSWIALKFTHPGESPVAPLPDNRPRHEGLTAPERPDWDRRRAE
ncbi:hypothetical protein GCM10010401_22760 [Rarobacter faecitabidus]|uniref:Uncharacterized protein n=1 Tax=Rarobacter faecitabidus TaxID=13243 RepID=A0A542ZVT4_RARFA|nr:hypothetical protein [Rarobacter faecitabidus]TQL64478.1 hypothetical protein FB461_0982 [Rarobacter faecitabidus]